MTAVTQILVYSIFAAVYIKAVTQAIVSSLFHAVGVYIIIVIVVYAYILDCSAYAHYVFNTFDQDHSGTISFEVNTILVTTRVRCHHIVAQRG